jgi:hypothetical protein
MTTKKKIAIAVGLGLLANIFRVKAKGNTWGTSIKVGLIVPELVEEAMGGGTSMSFKASDYAPGTGPLTPYAPGATLPGPYAPTA